MNTRLSKSSIAAGCLALALSSTSFTHAAISTFLAEGDGCNGGPTANFVTDGMPVKVSICATTTVEGICGASFYPKIGFASQNGHFAVAARVFGTAIPDANGVVPFPVPLTSTANYSIDYGGTSVSPTPQAPGANQLLATILLRPSAAAIDPSYAVSLDMASEIAYVNAGGNCFSSDPLTLPLSGSMTLQRASAPQFESTNTVSFTVGFPGTHQVVVTGFPAPTLAITMGALPSGVTLNGVNSTISGTPNSGTVGNHTIRLSATNASGTVVQNFTLTVQRANQAISFAPLSGRPFGSASFAIAATSSSGLPVSFASATPSVCTLSIGNIVSIDAAGTCSIQASQAGNLDFNPALPITQQFVVTAIAPSAPLIGTATPGNASVSVSFSAPMNTGGAAIQSYTATCGAQSAIGAMSPITVTGLANGTPVSCTVTAFNGTATSVPSSASNSVTPSATFIVTPSAGPNGTISPAMPIIVAQGGTTMFTVMPSNGFVANVTGTCGGTLSGNQFTVSAVFADCTVIANFTPTIALVRVESRKLHGAFICNLPIITGIPINGNVSVEPRSAGTGHQVVFVFDAPVTSVASASVAPTGTASPVFSGNEVRVNLGGVADTARVTVSISGVNGVLNPEASLGLLRGDVTRSYRTSAADIATVKSRIDAALTQANCAADVNVDGQIKSSDVSLTKSRSGSTLP